MATARSIFLIIIVFFSVNGFAAPVVQVAIEEPVLQAFLQADRTPGLGYLKTRVTSPLSSENDINLLSLKLSESEIDELSRAVHGRFQHCGGFFAGEWASFTRAEKPYKGKLLPTQASVVTPLLDLVDGKYLEDTVNTLAGFENRYYRSETGVSAAQTLLELFRKAGASRSDVDYELVSHPSWPQPSVRVRLRGAKLPQQLVILGGHIDSLSQSGQRAPGADDNASGAATLLQVFSILAQSGFQPDRTIEFIGYAAEEAGLRGSGEIAAQYAKQGKDVIGVLQNDMVLKAPRTPSITLISDWTNKEQNQFLAALIDTYVKVPWGSTTCGYACSDHASWRKAGFAASYSFETPFDEYNQNIHTEGDTFEGAGGSSDHALLFVKLGLAYAVEQASEN